MLSRCDTTLVCDRQMYSLHSPQRYHRKRQKGTFYRYERFNGWAFSDSSCRYAQASSSRKQRLARVVAYYKIEAVAKSQNKLLCILK